MTRVVAALKKLGIADADIQTTILSLQPIYDYSANTNPPRLTGYTLANSVSVTVRNLDNVGDAIDNSLAAGATTLRRRELPGRRPGEGRGAGARGRDGPGEGQGGHPRQGRWGVNRWRRLDQRDGRPDPVPDRLRLRERRAAAPDKSVPTPFRPARTRSRSPSPSAS